MAWFPFGGSTGAQGTAGVGQSQITGQTSSPAYGGTIGTAAGLATGIGGLVYTGSGSTITISGISHSGQAIQIGLTQEETEEFNRLKQEHEQEVKLEKLKEFKSLPSELRQYVITAISWNEAVSKMSSVSVPMNNRLQDLYNKDTNGRLFAGGITSVGGFTMGGIQYSGGGGSGGYSWTVPVTQAYGIALPDGITVEDLRQAHLEQTLEDEITNEQVSDET